MGFSVFSKTTETLETQKQENLYMMTTSFSRSAFKTLLISACLAGATAFAVETNNISWPINGQPGRGLSQSTISIKRPAQNQQGGQRGGRGGFGGGFGGGGGNVSAVAAYPVSGLPATIEPSLYIIQEDGTHNLRLNFVESKERKIDANATETTFMMKDPAYPVTVDLIVTTYAKEDVITSQIHVKNNGTKDITILNRDSAFISIPNSNNTYLTSFYGNWGSEMTNLHEDLLPIGITKHVNSQISRVAVPDYPGCVVSFNGKAQEETGNVFIAAVAWSGSWEYSVSRADNGQAFFTAGTLPSPRKLTPNQEYTSPKIVFTYSSQGKGQASRNLHDYGRNYGIYNGNKERPIVLNSWEGVYMDFNQEKLTDMIKRAADAGAEYFALDDGWFGTGSHARNNDRAGLGDWVVNPQKLPGGIEYLCDTCEQNGIRFGIWVEPEMVNPNSALFEAHPEYAVQLKHRNRQQIRNQYNLDLTNEEVEQYVYDCVANILSKHPRIGYIKWDHNASANANPGSPAHPDDQGAFNDRLSEGYYRVMAKLRKNFPNVIFQACSSGGQRGDLGAMEYSEEFWASDQTNGINRVSIQWGWSHFFPSKAIAAHIGRLGTQCDFKFRADVAMTARLGIELDPKALRPDELTQMKQGIQTYKTLRPFLHAADLYRGRDPHASQTTELTFVGKDKKQAVFFGFKRANTPVSENLKVSGLDPQKQYRMTELNKDTEARIQEKTMSGADLMSKGIPVTFPQKVSSVVVKLEAAN